MSNALHPGETMTIPVQPFGRIARNVAGYGVATALMLVSPFMVFVPASLFHCAMRNGRRVAWAAGVLALVLAGLLFFATPSGAPAQANMTYASFLAVALAVAVPSIIAAPLVERQEPFGVVLTFALFFSTIGLGITELIMRTTAHFSAYAAIVSEQTALATQKAAEYSAGLNETTLGRAVLWLFMHIPQVLTATILVYVALFFILSLMMVGRLSAWRTFTTPNGNAAEIRRAYLFRNFALPDWLLFVFVFGGITPLLTGPAQHVAANALALMISLYVLQGVAIFRFMLVRAGAGLGGTLIGFFILAMLCMTAVGLLMLALAGLFDPFFDFRHLKRKDDSHESHTD